MLLQFQHRSTASTYRGGRLASRDEGRGSTRACAHTELQKMRFIIEFNNFLRIYYRRPLDDTSILCQDLAFE
eukprot:4401405-Amphidinium_carterae.1